MLKSLTSLLLVAAVIHPACAQRASTSRWIGSWQLDRSASHFVGFVVGIHHVANTYRFDLEGTSVQVGDDGKDYATAPTRTTSFKQLGPRQWVRTHKMNGTKLDESVFTLSPDSQSFVIHTVAADAQGARHTSDETFLREGAGTGINGIWRSTSTGINATERFEIAPFERTGLLFSFPAEGVQFASLLDGSLVPYTGVHAVPSVRVAVQAVSAAELRRTDFLNGKPYQEEVDTLSPDGRQITAVSWHVRAPADKDRAVYRRQ